MTSRSPICCSVCLVVVATFWLSSAFVAVLRADDVVPADPPLQWFKGNLHTHSLWSDGNDFPEMIAEWYRVNGYNFLALSDHNVLSQGQKWIDVALPANRGAIGGVQRYRERFGDSWVEMRKREDRTEIRLKPLNEFRALAEERGKFLLIQAEEITDSVGSLPIHVNATNLHDTIKPQGGQDVRQAIANNLIAVDTQSKRLGRPMLGHVNHPNFGYAITAEDLAAVIEERFFEVFNGHPDVHHLGDETHPATEILWDIANTIRLAEMNAPPLLGVATDDSHNYFGLRGSSPGRGWVMVRSTHLTPESLIKAIQRGEFYGSTGVSLDEVYFDKPSRTLSLTIAAEEGVTYTTRFIGTPVDYDRHSEPLLDENGNEVHATRRYSADVGVVFGEVAGTNPSYTLTGNELYVRATVTSSKPPENPLFDGQKQQAWTQPVGWEIHVETDQPADESHSGAEQRRAVVDVDP